MIGTYYRTGEGWKSTLILNNKGTHPIAVTLTLYSQSGQGFTPPALSVNGLSPLEVDLNALAKAAGPQFKEGSFEFSYTGKILEMGGGLRIVNAEKSLIFDEQMLEPGMKFSAPQLESVFAIPYESAQIDLIVTNTTANLLVIDGQATFTGNPVRLPIPFALAPHQSRTFTLPHALIRRAKAGAVSLKHNGDKGALLAMLHIREEDRDFSATVNFSNYATGQTSSLHGAGLRIGAVEGVALKPVVAVRNAGENPTTVTAKIPYTKTDQSSGVISLPQLALGPGEIGFLDTSNPQLRKSDFDAAGLEIEYTGIPGGVVASAYSVSASGNHVFTLPLKDPKSGLSSTGGYPWFINETSSTVVFIKNTTTEPRQFTLDIIYPGGRWGSNLRTLAPGQTFKLDVREIRDSQIKGSEGDTIPPDATVGHISWSAHGKDSHKTLIGRAQTVDVANGLVSTYECQRCCGDNFYGARLAPGSVTGFIGGTQQFLAQEQSIDCYYQYVSGWFNTGSAVAWSSTNTNVMIINPIPLGALGTAVGAGSASIGALWTSYTWFADDAQGCITWDAVATPEATCDVQAPDFTITHDKTSSGIRPSGIIAGTNGADPPIPTADTQATVTVSTNPLTSGQNVTLSVVATENGEFDAGGHVTHAGVRPVGTLSRTSGTTDQNGVFTATYTAPIFGGGHSIRATMNGVTKEVGIGVFIDGLSLLGAGDDYDLVGETTTHPINHFGTATAIANLPLIASDYLAMFPGSAKLRFNDMSVSQGGKFEIAGDWGNGSHAEHRVGRNCDVGSSNVPTNRWQALNLIFLSNKVASVNDETASANHWHLRFQP
jgi:hypothetical protein